MTHAHACTEQEGASSADRPSQTDKILGKLKTVWDTFKKHVPGKYMLVDQPSTLLFHRVYRYTRTGMIATACLTTLREKDKCFYELLSKIWMHKFRRSYSETLVLK